MSLELMPPKTWATVPLPDVANLNMGQSPSSVDVNEVGEGLVFFQGKAEFGKLHPTARKYCTTPKKIAETNDILLSVRAPVGPTNLANQTTAIGRGLAAIKSFDGIDYKYLFHYFRAIEPWMSEQGTGSTFKAISGQFLKELPVTIAPLAEQKQIAAKLDELLAQVDTLKTRLDAIPAILKRFRQSVLAAAVSGRLTEEWRERHEVTESWKKYEIEQLAKREKYALSIGPFGSNLKVIDYRTEGHPLVFVREIRAEAFGGDETKYVSSEKFNELKAHRVSPGDILITKMGDPPGDVSIYPNSRPEAVITADCIKFAANESIVLTFFSYYSMKSERFREQVLGISAGVAQQKVNLKRFRGLTLDIPSIEEQTEIVHRVEQLFSFAEQIEQRLKAAQSRVNHLTQSILAKAFRGELTADWREQNPDLISGEHSAAALLARIKAEKERLKPVKKKRGARK
jgi:type I restriction enzyme S subunit